MNEEFPYGLRCIKCHNDIDEYEEDPVGFVGDNVVVELVCIDCGAFGILMQDIMRYSDKGNRRRPGIPGTQKTLDRRVLEILQTWSLPLSDRCLAAVAQIEVEVRKAYRLVQ